MNEATPYRKLAIFLHSRFCTQKAWSSFDAWNESAAGWPRRTWNHADGCAWYYESNTDESPRKGTEDDLWKQPAHAQWFETACQVYNKTVGIFNENT